MKTLLLLFVLIPGLLRAESPSRILTPVESPPQVIDGLEFTVVTQAEWPLPGPLFGSIVLQLHVTNRRDNPILFPSFDSFHPVLTTSSGETVRFGGGRDATRITPNVFLHPGKSFALSLEAKIDHKRDGNEIGFVLRDGTGTVYEASLTAGNYLISFSLSPTHYDFERAGKLPAPLWTGKGATESVGFRLNPPRER
jgi:hypothetical protein